MMHIARNLVAREGPQVSMCSYVVLCLLRVSLCVPMFSYVFLRVSLCVPMCVCVSTCSMCVFMCSHVFPCVPMGSYVFYVCLCVFLCVPLVYLFPCALVCLRVPTFFLTFFLKKNKACALVCLRVSVSSSLVYWTCDSGVGHGRGVVPPSPTNVFSIGTL
jgi:hypothetical protein